MFVFKNSNMTDLFQWSTDIALIFDAKYVGEDIHFSNNKKTSIKRTVNKDGEVTIPNSLLQSALPLEVYLFVQDENGAYTKYRRIVRVLARPKPEGYVDTTNEDEILVWDSKLDIYQGVEFAGQVLTIDSEGNISPVPLSSGGNDVTFTYAQNAAMAEWNITHNLNKYPSVTIVDSANTVVIGEIIYNDLNSVTIKFSSAFSGKAILN